MDLRDHDLRCKHKWAKRNIEGEWVCLFGYAGDPFQHVGRCPGGDAVNVDYEAAAAAYLDDDMHGNLELIETCARKVVDAALGVTSRIPSSSV